MTCRTVTKHNSPLRPDFRVTLFTVEILSRVSPIRISPVKLIRVPAHILRGNATAGKNVAVIGAGGIGFDVSEYLVHEGDSPTENLPLWMKEWGVADPAEHRSGLAPQGPQPEAPARNVTLLQRKAEKPGKRLGKTTGWIHRATLKMNGVQMIADVNYERIEGYHR